MDLGTLFGFGLFIKRLRVAFVEIGMFEYHYKNTFYAENK
jgi:hypothetical protein